MINNRKKFIKSANNVTKDIMQYLKDTAKETAGLISTKLETERQKQAASQQQIRQEQQAVCSNNIMLQLQYGLWCIFSHITPPVGLIKIVYISDLIPCGWKITPDGILFVFRWSKTNAEPFQRTYLEIILKKLNAAIFIFRQRLLNEYEILPYPENELLRQQFPLTFRGFSIVKVIDNPVDIILVIKLW